MVIMAIEGTTTRTRMIRNQEKMGNLCLKTVEWRKHATKAVLMTFDNN